MDNATCSTQRPVGDFLEYTDLSPATMRTLFVTDDCDVQVIRNAMVEGK
jgi:hypothetical protein